MAPDDDTVNPGKLDHPDEPAGCECPENEQIKKIILKVADEFLGEPPCFIQRSVNFRIQLMPDLSGCQVTETLVKCVLEKHGRLGQHPCG